LQSFGYYVYFLALRHIFEKFYLPKINKLKTNQHHNSMHKQCAVKQLLGNNLQCINN